MSRLTYFKNIYSFTPTSSREREDARAAGLKLGDTPHVWVTRSHQKARTLRRYADASAENKLKRKFITDLAPPECIVYPDHLAPRSWQMESAWHALTRTPAYIADEAGLGKTITAILATNSSPGKALIVCPPYLAINWAIEMQRWSVPPVCGVIWPDSKLTGEHLETLKRQGPFKWLIVDEAHRFKTESAQRTQALLKEGGIYDLAERTVFLSGTPIPNGKPIELYPLLSAVAPDACGSRNIEEYGKRFCAGHTVHRYERGRPIYNWDFSGASHLGELKDLLSQQFMIRHTKQDHLKELGPKTRQLIFLDAPERIHRLERGLLEDIPLEDLLGEFNLGSSVKLGDIAIYRREVGLSKIDAAIEYITDLLESGPDKIVVSAYHIEVVEKLTQAFSSFHPLKIRGGMTAKQKNKAVQDFQTKDKHRVVVGNTLSMGLGNTLTRAPLLVCVEPEWTPGVNEQMEDRIHRMSQDKHVYCKYLVLRNSLDERMLHRALGKEDRIHELMN